MEHAVRSPRAPFLSPNGALEIHQIPAAEDNLVWIVRCTETNEAAVVDGPDAEGALAYAEAHGITLSAILNTHTHFDHIGINRDLAQRGQLDRFRVYGSAKTADSIPGLTDPLEEGDAVTLGASTARVMHTEGHIDGHLTYVFDGVAFTGDALFAGGCGRMFAGPATLMAEGLAKLAALPPETLICCAHEYTQDNLRFAWSVEPDNEALAERIRQVWALRARGECAVPSTLGEELATNPFLRGDQPTLRANVSAAFPNAPLTNAAEIFAATRGLKDGGAYRASGDTPLPLT